jgi:hypothetical protein
MLGALLAIFAFIAYWFIAHSFVIVRLTSVFGVLAFLFLAVLAVVYLRRL